MVKASKVIFEFDKPKTQRKDAAMEEPKYFEWTVKFRISELWVGDGFDLTADRAHQIMWDHLRFAEEHEIEAEIVSAPDYKEIRAAQAENVGFTEDF